MDKSFAMQTVAECLSRLDDRIGRIEAHLTVLAKERTVRESYSTKQLGRVARKGHYSVREWCRLGRIGATKLRRRSRQ